MALRQMLGVACLVSYIILATTVVAERTYDTGGAVHVTPQVSFPNSTVSRSSSGSASKISSTPYLLPVDSFLAPFKAASSLRAFSRAEIVSLERPRPTTRVPVSPSSSGEMRSHAIKTLPLSSGYPASTTASAPYTIPNLSDYGATISSPVPSERSAPRLSTPTFKIPQPSNATYSPTFPSDQAVKIVPQLRGSGSSVKLLAPSSTQQQPGTSMKGNTAKVLTANGSGSFGLHASQQQQQSSRGMWSNTGSPPKTGSSGIAAESSKLSSLQTTLAIAGPGSMYNTTAGLGQNAMSQKPTTVPSGALKSSTFVHRSPSNSTVVNPTLSSSPSSLSNFANSSLSGSTFTNSTLSGLAQSNSTKSNSTLSSSIASHSTFPNATFSNSTSTNSTVSNSPTSNWASPNSTFSISTSSNSTITNSTFSISVSSNSTFSNSTSSNKTLASIMAAIGFKVPGSKALGSVTESNRYLDTTLYQEIQCSNTVTHTSGTVTSTVTSTVTLDETMTMTGNASTPLPVFMTPLSACSTESVPSVPGVKHPGGGPPTQTSTLLVTKKTPVVIRSPQTVGPIFDISLTAAQSVASPPVAVETQAGLSQPQQAALETQGSGGSSAESQSQSSGQSVAQSADGDQSPGSAPLHQVFAESNAPSAPSGSGQSGTSQTGSNSNEAQSSVAGGQSSSAGQSPGNGGKTSGKDQHSGNEEQSPGGGTQSSNGGQPSGAGIQSPSNVGQSSGAVTQSTSNGGGSPGDVSQPVSNGGQTLGKGDQPSSGGGQASGNEGQSGSSGSEAASSTYGSPSDSSQPSSGQTASNPPTVGGSATGSQHQDSESGSPSLSGDQPTSENPISIGGSSTVEGGTSLGNIGGIDSSPDHNVPTAVTVGNVPISIANSVVIIGSQTITAGSPPTTVVANGQTITVGPSQIVAPGTTIPIEAAVTSPPATSTRIGGVPVVLQPSDIVIGSQTFSHGSSAAFAVYNGQTYSWDAKQLVGPDGTMVTFPSATSLPPLITAGGQIFSVYPSTLKASGTDIILPNTPSASPFVYNGQTYSVNPSQLVALNRSITIPPASQPTPFVYNSQTFSIDESQFIAPSATIPLSSGSGTVRYGTDIITIQQTQVVCPNATIALSPQVGRPATPSAITTGGVTLSLGPSAAVIGSSTYSILPGKAPATITDQRQVILVGTGGVQFGTISIPVPTNPPSYSMVTQGDLTFSLAPSAVILSGHTDDISPSMAPVYTVVSGHTISIGPQGVGLPSTTIALPASQPSYATVTDGGLTLSVASSQAIVEGTTFAVGPNKPGTMVVGGQTLSIGGRQIYIPGTTVNIPTPTNYQAPAPVTADGLTFSVGPTDAFIGGTAYAIGSGAIDKTIVVGSQIISLGTNGVILPSMTVPPEQTPSVVITTDDVTISADATEAIINGTAYAIGSEAIAKTIVVGSETIRLGTKGIVLPSTTIAPWGNATQTGFSSTYGTMAASSSMPDGLPTVLPGTGPEGTKNDIHKGVGSPLRPSTNVFLSMIVGVIMLGLMLM